MVFYGVGGSCLFLCRFAVWITYLGILQRLNAKDVDCTIRIKDAVIYTEIYVTCFTLIRLDINL